MGMRFNHVVLGISGSFLFKAEQFLRWIHHNLFIHSPDDGYLGRFQFEEITNKLL